jgi:3-hydroxybutyryl-CoA dehydrogenase
VTVTKVAIVGCGTMGRGIAQVCAAAGIRVAAIKMTGTADEPARALRDSLAGRVAQGKMTADAMTQICQRVEFTTDIAAVRGAELVIESVVESLETKLQTLRRVEHEVDSGAVLASNTSTLPLESLAAGLRRRNAFVGLHFFMPVPAMPLVEIGPLPATDESVVQRCETFCMQIGKTPVMVGPSPGYVVNRLLVPYLLHTIEVLEAGVADAHALDTAMQLGCGYPMGPLALADLIGLDVLRAMAMTLANELGPERHRCPPLLEALAAANHLGRKTQRGFYDYAAPAPTTNAFVLKFIAERAAARAR